MQINIFNQNSSLLSIAQQYARSGNNIQKENNSAASTKAESADTFVRTSNDSTPSGVYGLPGGIQPISSSSESSSSTLMSKLSNAFRANQDSIESAMNELGLTEEDLNDAENLTALANAMNEGAENLGLPQIENVDEVVESILNGEEVSSEENPVFPAEGSTPPKAPGGMPPAGGPGGPGGSGGNAPIEEEDDDDDDDDETTTTKIINAGDISFIETEKTENGVKSTTRTMLGGSIGGNIPGGVSSSGGIPSFSGSFSGMSGVNSFNARNFASRIF